MGERRGSGLRMGSRDCTGVWGHFVSSFSKYLLCADCVPGPLLGTGDTVVIGVCRVTAVMELTFPCSGVGWVTGSEQVNIPCGKG